MRNSAWYHKLWRKKLDKYPLKEDADSSWAEMKGLLDEHLPVDNTINNKPAKFLGGTVISMLSFILPAAAMIGAITYVAVKHPFKNKEVNKRHYHLVPKRLKGAGTIDSLDKTSDTVKADSAANDHKEDLTAANTTQINKVKQSSGQPITNTVLSAPYTNHRSNNHANGNAAGNKNLLLSTTVKTGTQKTTQQLLGAGNSAPVQTGPVNNKTNKDSTDIIKNIAGSNNQTGNNTTANNGSDKQAKPLKNDAAGSKIKPVVKSKPTSVSKIKSPKQSNGTSPFDFNISAGINAGKGGSNVVIGAGVTYTLNPKWLLNAGLKMDIDRPLSGTFSHPSYFRPDTSFTINDTRKLNIITVPVTLEYNISDIISVNAGPQISFSAKQSKLSTKVGTVLDRRDTLLRTHTIDSALMINSINKITVGISGGISIKLNQFYIDGTYQQNLTPYNVTTGLGGYKQYYRSFQIGLRYKFKKKNR